MIILDVNVLVYAYGSDSPRHALCKAFLDDLVAGSRAFGVPEMAFSSLVRITTLPVWKPPSTTAQALDFCQQLMSAPACLVLRPGENHWKLFDHLCRTTHARGKLVADAYLAAFALDREDEWVTTDGDFKKFPGLTWRYPDDAQARTNPR